MPSTFPPAAFTTYSRPRFSGREGKKKITPSPIDTSAADAYRTKQAEALETHKRIMAQEQLSPEEFVKAVHEAGGLSASFVKKVEQTAHSPEATAGTREFLEKFYNYLPILKQQASNPSSPDHNKAKNFLAVYETDNPETSHPLPEDSGFKEYLPAKTYKPCQ